MDILHHHKPQSRASLNSTITTLTNQLYASNLERDEFRRECDALAEALHAAIDGHRVTELMLARTKDSLHRLIDVDRTERRQQQRRAA